MLCFFWFLDHEAILTPWHCLINLVWSSRTQKNTYALYFHTFNFHVFTVSVSVHSNLHLVLHFQWTIFNITVYHNMNHIPVYRGAYHIVKFLPVPSPPLCIFTAKLHNRTESKLEYFVVCMSASNPWDEFHHCWRSEEFHSYSVGVEMWGWCSLSPV